MTRIATAFTAVFTVFSVLASQTDLRRGFSDVAKKAVPAVVSIQVEKTRLMQQGVDPFEQFFGMRRGPQPPRPFKQQGQGSGFIITKDGYILTNTHVVGDADKITVKLTDGRSFTAKRIGADPRTEIAVIKIDAANLPILEFGDPSKLETGEWVIAIGNPFGLSETLTVGVVSAKGRSNIGITDYEDFIQTDAAINPGNSGGPLLNIDGQVVGINTAIYSQSGGYMGIGFAVPIDMAVAVKDQLVKDGKVTRGYLAVALNPGEVDEEMAKSFGLKKAGGVLLAEVMEDGPAAKAGLKAGDIITELNGEPVKDSVSFRRDIARIVPGTSVEATFFRDGKQQKTKVIVGTYPGDGDGKDDPVSPEDKINRFGFSVQPLNRELAGQFGFDRENGIVVTEVQEGSLAAEAGLRPGLLILRANRAEIRNMGQFRKAVSEKGNLLLQVQNPDGQRRFILLKEEK